MIVLGLLACAPPPIEAEPVAASPFVALDDERLARRISIDLRGQLPTMDELELAQTPGGIDTLVDTWLADPAYEQHLVDVFAESWLLRVDALRIGPEEFGFEHDADGYDFTRTIGDEPAHLMAHVAADDAPWSDIVTTDTTMANATLAQMVQLEWVDPDTSKEWREARYTDGRPPGGVLMTSGLWLRYSTTIFNYNRGRAAALGRLLLCYDFLTRPVLFSDVAEKTTDGLAEAITTEPGCIACHAGLDPLAGTLFGFWPFEDKDGAELATYHPEREGYGETLTGRVPAYFGTPVDAASELGPLVAADPRFEMCTVTRTAERLWGRPTTAEDLSTLVGLRADFRAGEGRYNALVRAILASDEYRAGALAPDATAAEEDSLHPLRLLSPNTLADVVEESTGLRWVRRHWDELDSDTYGYRVLLGGADGDTVRESQLEPTLSRSLAIRRLAQAAAETAVARDFGVARADRRLVGTTVDDPTTLVSTDPAFADELTRLHHLLYGAPPTDAQLDEEAAFFEDVRAISDIHGAWVSLLTVLMRDPSFWSY